MRSVSLVTGLVAKARRYVAQAASVSLHTQEGEKEPSMGEVSKALRQMALRLNKMEAALPPEATEFEVVLGTGGAITELTHNFGGPVRWWVTCWMQPNNVAYPVDAPNLAMDSTSDQDTLRLRSYRAGRAVIRVEPSQTYLDPGIVVAASPDNVRLSLANNFTTTSTTPVSTGLKFPVKAGEVWRVHFVGGAGDSNANGMKWCIGAPVGSTMDGWHYSSTVNIATRSYLQVSTINVLWAAVHTVAGGERDDEIIIVVKVAIDGEIDLQCATVTGGSTATVYAKSSLVAQKVTEV